MKKYTPSFIFLAGTLLLAFITFAKVYAITTSTLNTDALANVGQLLFVGPNGQIASMPNSYATTTPDYYEVNIGAYAAYPNPNGMFNTYFESPGNQPVLGGSFMGRTNNYLQGVFVQNLATGSSASADIVVADDKGSATSSIHYLDLGMANTGQVDANHSLIQQYDGYLYNQDSRLILGTATTTASSTVVISMGMQSSSPSLTVDRFGHLITHGVKPVLSGCTGATIDSNANDVVGNVTLPSLAILGSCVVTFSGIYGTPPKCQVTNNGGITLNSISISATAMTYNVTAALGGGSFTYQCLGSN